MPIIHVDDPHDPRLAPYGAIRERDLSGREGRFVAEGKVVLNVLFAARRFTVESALVLENRVAGLADTLALAPPDMPVYVAAQPVMDAIAGFHIHRGVLAVGLRRPPDAPEVLLDSLPPQAVVVVLVGLSNHDNVGAVFRSAAAFGAGAVLLDRTCCDPLYRKAIRVSVGAALKVPFAVAEDPETLTDSLAQRGFSLLGLSPAGAIDIRAAPRPPRVALFLGSEGDGLPAALMQRLETVRIGMAEGLDSLNVAAAAAIALHHFSQA